MRAQSASHRASESPVAEHTSVSSDPLFASVRSCAHAPLCKAPIPRCASAAISVIRHRRPAVEDGPFEHSCTHDRQRWSCLLVFRRSLGPRPIPLLRMLGGVRKQPGLRSWQTPATSRRPLYHRAARDCYGIPGISASSVRRRRSRGLRPGETQMVRAMNAMHPVPLSPGQPAEQWMGPQRADMRVISSDRHFQC